jgi:hypothetical protein
MADEKNKQPKTYSLSPIVIAWVTQKAARLTLEKGERASESELVNRILLERMSEDQRTNKKAAKAL